MDFLSFILGLVIITGFPVGCGLHSAKQIAKMEVKKDGLSVWLEKLSPSDREKMVRLKNIVEYWGRTLKYNEEISQKHWDEINYISQVEVNSCHEDINFRLAQNEELNEKLCEMPDSMDSNIMIQKSKILKKINRNTGKIKEWLGNLAFIPGLKKKYLNAVEQTVESEYGKCLDFALLLQSNAKEIGFDMYLLTPTGHASCLYNINGQWYVGELTGEVEFSKHDGRKNLRAPNQIEGFVSEHHRFAIPLAVYLADFSARKPDAKFHVQRYNLDTDREEDVELFDFLESYRNGTLHQGNVKYSLFD